MVDRLPASAGIGYRQIPKSVTQTSTFQREQSDSACLRRLLVFFGQRDALWNEILEITLTYRKNLVVGVESYFVR
jgi:hypothetical protein